MVKTHQYILLAIDNVSRWVNTIPTPTSDAKAVLKFIQRKILTRFGTPRGTISNGGSHFCNRWIAGLLTKFGIKYKVTTSYHPQANGQTVLVNRVIKRVFEKTVDGQEKIGRISWMIQFGLIEWLT